MGPPSHSVVRADGASADFTPQFPQGVPAYSRGENNDASSSGTGGGGLRDLRNKLGPLGPDGGWKQWPRRLSPFCRCVLALTALSFFFCLQDGLQRRKGEGACVTRRECRISSQGPQRSSPALTSLAPAPRCFSCSLSCFCQTLSRSRKRKSGRQGTRQAEAGGDAKALRPGLLRVLGKSKMQPHWSL